MATASSPTTSAGREPALRTLRSLIAQRAAAKQRFTLAEVVAIVVPICTDLVDRHARGEVVLVHGSSIGAGPDGMPRYLPDLAAVRPSDPADLAAVAPEVVAGSAPNAHSSVFGLGAIAYEMLTLEPVHAGLTAPSTIVPGLPPAVDNVLAKALLQDPSARPGHIEAFAQALHHLSPKSIAPPPPAGDDFEVDIDMRSSMLPIAPAQVAIAAAAESKRNVPAAIAADPFAAVVDMRASAPDPQKASQNRQLEELGALKARLEADPVPRWIVVKDKMDHGPFSGIELLQQVATDSFTGEMLLIDSVAGTKMLIKEHPEISRFAHHAELKRDAIKEQKAVVAAESREKKAGAAKGTIGALLVVGVLGAVVFGIYSIQKARAEKAERQKNDEATSIAAEGSVKAKEGEKKKVASGGGGGGYGGRSAEDALKNAVSGMDDDTLIGGECTGPIGNDVALGCGLSGFARVKAVVQKGRAIGVTVTTEPNNPGVNACMAGRVSGISWKSTPGASVCIKTFKVN